jgi:hypothetical protein
MSTKQNKNNNTKNKTTTPAPTPAQNVSNSKPKAKSSVANSNTKPKYVEVPKHTFRAVDQELTNKYTFTEALDLYREHFLSELKLNRNVLTYYKNTLAYLIDPKTGQPCRSKKLTYSYKPTDKTSVELDGKKINFTLFLNDPKFRDEVINYYKTNGCKCEIVRENYKSPYNDETKRFSKVAVYIDY